MNKAVLRFSVVVVAYVVLFWVSGFAWTAIPTSYGCLIDAHGNDVCGNYPLYNFVVGFYATFVGVSLIILLVGGSWISESDKKGKR